MSNTPDFRATLRLRFEHLIERERARFPDDEVLRMDLHCHDKNSDVPDEIIGRLIRSRETWLETDQLVERLHAAGMDVVTVTNHNNARSCHHLRARGIDALVSAEFTCFVPDYAVYIHVLTYGFSESQETQLEARTYNLYRFLDYAAENRISTVWAHPLYVYKREGLPPLEFFEKLTLCFARFEVLNGHRDAWQNLLFATWLDSLTPERIEELATKHRLRADRFCERPYHKAMSGGSDCHMGMFAGTCGVRLHVPGLAERRKTTPLSDLAAEALWEGRIAPFGRYSDVRRIAAAFLDYTCQVQMNLDDAGLLRLLLHKGTTKQKLIALAAANGVFELRRHKYTSRFVETVHAALHGKGTGFFTRNMTFREYRPILDQLDAIAMARSQQPEKFEEAVIGAIPEIFGNLSRVLATRIEGKVAARQQEEAPTETGMGLGQLLERFEVPLHLRALAAGGRRQPGGLSDWMDGLPFPAMAAGLIGVASYTSAKVMFSARPMLQSFAEQIGELEHPQRALWLTDTLFDKNGVSRSLGLKLEAAREFNLPIDFATCHGTAEEADHLHLLRPLAEFRAPAYKEQLMRVFDMLDLQQRFLEGGYDRVICSTEFLMGPAALYLKHAFNVPAYFFLHTDWLMFAERSLHLQGRELDRLRRFLRAFYRSFDGIFVMNQDQSNWLASDAIGVDPEKIFLTAHWADECFRPRPVTRADVIPQVGADEPIILFAGRLSEEKGVLDLPEILRGVREAHPRARLVVAGVGPAREALERAVPDAIFLGWVDRERLAELNSVAAVGVLPSRFDTFCCSLLEAQHCGLPVVAYSVMGPKEIIKHGRTGYLVDDCDSMVEAVTLLLSHPRLREDFGREARQSAAFFERRAILRRFLGNVGLRTDSLGDDALESQDGTPDLGQPPPTSEAGVRHRAIQANLRPADPSTQGRGSAA